RSSSGSAENRATWRSRRVVSSLVAAMRAGISHGRGGATRMLRGPPTARVGSVAVKACLNGARTKVEHPAVPQTPAELAADAVADAGIGVEAGLASPADAEALGRSSFTHQLVRALVEVEDGVDGARAIAERIPEGIPQLWHGYDERTWEVLSTAQSAGIDVRV